MGESAHWSAEVATASRTQYGLCALSYIRVDCCASPSRARIKAGHEHASHPHNRDADEMATSNIKGVANAGTPAGAEFYSGRANNSRKTRPDPTCASRAGKMRQGKSDHTVARVDTGNRETTTDMSPPGRSLSRDNTADDSSSGTLPGEVSSTSPQAVLQCNSAAAHSLSTNAATGCNATVLPLPSPPRANSPLTLLCPSLPHGDVPSDEVARDNHNYIPLPHPLKPDSSAATPMTTAKNDRSLSVPPGLEEVRQRESDSEAHRVGSENPETTTTAITPLLTGAPPDEVESDDHYHNSPVLADDKSCLELPLTSSSGAVSKIEVGTASQQTQVLHEPAAVTHSCSICDFPPTTRLNWAIAVYVNTI